MVDKKEKMDWITANPDNLADVNGEFPCLQEIQDYKYHVVLEAGDVLYLPSLW